MHDIPPVVIQMPGLPLVMFCHVSGQVAFRRGHRFHPIMDVPENGVPAIITMDDIFVGKDTVVEYNTYYQLDEHPELKQWLMAQNLQMPNFNQ